jgi:prepilin-type N-terminal cleavage/methylation domain-containing protein
MLSIFRLLFKKKQKSHPHTSWQGATLLEMLIVLVLIGVLAGAVLKGWTLVQQGRLRKLGGQVQTYVNLINHYKESYMHLPGEKENQLLGIEGLNVPNALSWQALADAGLTDAPSHKTPSGALIPAPCISGVCLALVRLEDPHSGVWILAGGESGNSNNKGCFTPAEAEFLLKSVHSSASTSEARIEPGAGEEKNKCLEDGNLNLKNKNKSCVVYFFVCP